MAETIDTKAPGVKMLQLSIHCLALLFLDFRYRHAKGFAGLGLVRECVIDCGSQKGFCLLVPVVGQGSDVEVPDYAVGR
jgi:hypothetical protein